MADPRQSELFFGLVGAAGTNLNNVAEVLEKCLRQVGFRTEGIRLSDFFSEIQTYESLLKDSPEEDRIASRMEAGDRFREETGLADAVALLAINKVRRIRIEQGSNNEKPLCKVAYIFNSLKHPKEVEALRKVYGKAFLLISVYSPSNVRKENLAKKIAQSHHDAQFNNFFEQAEKLIKRDESEIETRPCGQNVRYTFPMGDVFIDGSNAEELEKSLNRFVELVFGNTFHTPTNDEFGMFVAHAAARRSASLARQVGAVIINENGDIVAAGMNEVPRPEGGIHTAGQKPDLRNWMKGSDPSDERKTQILGDMLTRLVELGYIKEGTDVNKLVKDLRPKLKNAHMMNLIEFTREVHAEMAAITSAARNTISVNDCKLYTTTFPCHDCTKHIVASGIRYVIYIEPYAKSLAEAFYSDFISVDEVEESKKVRFRPFVCVAPRQYLELFEMVERKDSEGKVKPWINVDSSPRLVEPWWHYLLRETEAIDFLGKILEDKGVKLKYSLAGKA